MQAYNYMFNTENTLEHAYIRFILGLVTSLSKYSNSFLRLMMSRCMHGENAEFCMLCLLTVIPLSLLIPTGLYSIVRSFY